jgi:pyruvate carboxylase
MADGTSQPSLNSFVAMMEGAVNDTGINFLDLEAYDMYWARVRDWYVPFESGMKSGTGIGQHLNCKLFEGNLFIFIMIARVFEHQIPGGQYSNLLVQCQVFLILVSFYCFMTF